MKNFNPIINSNSIVNPHHFYADPDPQMCIGKTDPDPQMCIGKTDPDPVSKRLFH